MKTVSLAALALIVSFVGAIFVSRWQASAQPPAAEAPAARPANTASSASFFQGGAAGGFGGNFGSGGGMYGPTSAHLSPAAAAQVQKLATAEAEAERAVHTLLKEY